LRGGDGSANPYLAIAGALGAGLNGIQRNLDPGDPGAASKGCPLPLTLLHAVEALEISNVLCDVLDAAGDCADVSRYFARIKRDEFLAWHGTVSSWEIDHYLKAF
jgi:glutamine synthetase